MSWYNENHETIKQFGLLVVGIVGTWMTKDRISAFTEKKRSMREDTAVVVDSSQKVLDMMERVMKRLESDNHDCEKKLAEFRLEIDTLKAQMHMYRISVVEPVKDSE
jgi:SMC interacting uncharacterized protein involved in chromosome segregation